MVEVEQDRFQIRVDEWSKQAFEQISGFVDDLLLGLQVPSKRQKV
jgi:hypothetical protein